MALRHVTLGDIFRRNAQLFPDRTVIVCGFERMSHRWLSRHTGPPAEHDAGAKPETSPE